MLANRLANRYRHFSKWGRRQGISCFRLYERDIPEFPLIVDWYEGDVVAWFYHRTRDDTLEREVAYRKLAEEEIQRGLEISRDHLFIKYRARQRDEAGNREQYERFDDRGVIKIVEEFGLKFEVNLSDYLDTGLFLDHRFTRKMVAERASGKRVLNLFAYTGAFTVHARAGGASETVTVDMSKTYLAWAERNLSLNGFSVTPSHRMVHADCIEALAGGPQAEELFDIIVCDPPTFSNSKRMRTESFSIDRDWPQVIIWLRRFLAPGGVIYFSTNSRSLTWDDGVVPSDLHARDISSQTVPEDFRNERIHRCWRLEERRQKPQ